MCFNYLNFPETFLFRDGKIGGIFACSASKNLKIGQKNRLRLKKSRYYD